MKKAIAKASFRRSDTGEHVRRGDTITGNEKYIDELARVGKVYETGATGPAERKAHPPKAAGTARKSSASPAAPRSAKKTAKRSAAGAKGKKTGE